MFSLNEKDEIMDVEPLGCGTYCAADYTDGVVDCPSGYCLEYYCCKFW